MPVDTCTARFELGKQSADYFNVFFEKLKLSFGHDRDHDQWILETILKKQDDHCEIPCGMCDRLRFHWVFEDHSYLWIKATHLPGARIGDTPGTI